MKITTIAFGLLLAGLMNTLSLNAQAQSRGKKFSAGLKVGANYSQLDNLSYKTPRLGPDGLPMMSGGNIVYDFFQQNDGSTMGIVGGGYARFGRILYLQPEVMLSVKGGKMSLIREGMQTLSLNARVGTIDLPLLLGLRLGPLRLNAGPMASLTVMDGDLKGAVRKYSNQPLAQTTRETQFGYQAGIGLTFSGMQIDLRREGSLQSLRGATSAQEVLSARSSLWQLTAGFGF